MSARILLARCDAPSLKPDLYYSADLGWQPDPALATPLTSKEAVRVWSDLPPNVWICQEVLPPVEEPWRLALREACERSNQAAVARRLGVSRPLISLVLAGRYPSPTERLQALVEGVLLDLSVQCPVLGQINRADCVAWQGNNSTPTNPVAAQIARTCPNCPNFLR